MEHSTLALPLKLGRNALPTPMPFLSNPMKQTLWRGLIALAALMLGSAPKAEATPLGWQPQHTWVFVVGLVQFKDKDLFDSFDTANRRDEKLVQFFRGQGVPSDHIVYLEDKAATLKAIQTSLATLLQKTSAGDSLMFYYEGHGYRSDDETKPDAYFATYDTDDENVLGWSVSSIPPTIDRYFKGNRAFLTADCCYSGFLAETVNKNQGRIAYACVTSSSAREESTGHWTFTDCLLDALHGAPYVDLNGDGAVSVGEFATHAHDEMALAEEQHTSFSLANDFSRETVLAASGTRPPAPIGKRVKAKQDGVWYAARVVAVKAGQVEVKYIGYDEPGEWFDTDDATQLQWIKPQSTYSVGAAVEVKWQGDWYPAKVLKVDGAVYFIHYRDDDSSWDEWVSSKRIRAGK